MTPKPKRFSPLEIFLAILLVSAILGAGVWAWWTYTSESKIHTRDAQRKADVQVIKTAIEAYYEENGKYPVGAATIDDTNHIITCEIKQCLMSDIADDLAPYLATIPEDPLNSGKLVYEYVVNNSRNAYALYVTLEDDHDPYGPKPCKIGENLDALGATLLPCTF